MQPVPCQKTIIILPKFIKFMVLNYCDSFLAFNPIRVFLYVAIVVGIAKVCAIQRTQMHGKVFCIFTLWSV